MIKEVCMLKPMIYESMYI